MLRQRIVSSPVNVRATWSRRTSMSYVALRGDIAPASIWSNVWTGDCRPSASMRHKSTRTDIAKAGRSMRAFYNRFFFARLRMAIRVVLVGLGPIGAAVAKQLVERKGFQIVGAVDIDPLMVGKDAGDVMEIGRRLRIKVTNSIGATLKATRPDVAVLCTSSSLDRKSTRLNSSHSQIS